LRGERLVSEAELLFGSGLLAGMKLVGFSQWKSPEGEIYVIFPSRAFGAVSKSRFFGSLTRRSRGRLRSAPAPLDAEPDPVDPDVQPRPCMTFPGRGPTRA
jgi:hypothetical protein